MKSYLKISFILMAFATQVHAQVKVKYFNERFVWIMVPSKYVQARLNYPIDGYSVCWIEVVTPHNSFDFVFRRGLPFKNCLDRVLSIRKILKKNDSVEIIGMKGSKNKKDNYFSLWELIKGKNGECEGYFGDCENYNQNFPEWNDWKARPIDHSLYP